jgi:hypothetical protein
MIVSFPSPGLNFHRYVSCSLYRVFNDLKWEVPVRLVDIGGIVFVFSWRSNSLKVCLQDQHDRCHLLRAPDFTPFLWGLCCPLISLLFFRLAIVLSVLRVTANDYLFGIFILLLFNRISATELSKAKLGH